MRLELQENGVREDLELTRAQVDALLRVRGLSVTPSLLAPGTWCVQAGSVVGARRVADLELYVRPKLPVGRVVFLLGYARKDFFADDLVGLDADEELMVALAGAFARQAEQATVAGLLKGYRTEEAAAPVVRGRIRLAEQIGRRYGVPVPVELAYDEFDTDIAENRILRAGCEVYLSVPGLPARVRRRLLALRHTLLDVTTPVRGMNLPSWQPNRLNSRYATALRLAELAWAGRSLELRGGTVTVDGVMIDMAAVFEDFLGRALREALAPFGGTVHEQYRETLDEGRVIPIRPDVVWCDAAGRPGAVLDAKYKAEKPSGYPNADVYQMLAYCLRLGLPEGHLVYAAGGAPTRTHRIASAGVTIHQRVVNLGLPPAELLVQVNELARTLAGASGEAVGPRH